MEKSVHWLVLLQGKVNAWNKSMLFLFHAFRIFIEHTLYSFHLYRNAYSFITTSLVVFLVSCLTTMDFFYPKDTKDRFPEPVIKLLC